MAEKSYFCDAINGLRDNVDFGIQLLSETKNTEDDKFISLINVIIGEEDAPSSEEIVELTPRGVAMLGLASKPYLVKLRCLTTLVTRNLYQFPINPTEG